MKEPRKNRSRDEATCWSIVDALLAEQARSNLSKHQKRDFIRQRLAQEYRISPREIASRRNQNLYCTLTRIYYVANPRSKECRIASIEARRRGLHFLTCYTIAIGTKSLDGADADRSKKERYRKIHSLDDIESRFRDVLLKSFSSGFFTDEILQAFHAALREFESGGDLVRSLQSQAKH